MVDMSADLIIRLSEHPNIAGVKDSGGNLAKLGQIVKSVRPGFQVLAGSQVSSTPPCASAPSGESSLSPTSRRNSAATFSTSSSEEGMKRPRRSSYV